MQTFPLFYVAKSIQKSLAPRINDSLTGKIINE